MHRLLLIILAAAAVTPVVADPLPGGSAKSTTTTQSEQVVWRGAPIRVDLRVGTERIVRIPGATYLRSGLLGGPVPGLRVQGLGDSLYLLAAQPFASTRVLVQSDTGQSAFLDLAADTKLAAAPTLEILSSPSSSIGLVEEDAQAISHEQPVERSVGYVALIRHAAQSLYAPTRLIPDAHGTIMRAPVPSRVHVHLVRGAHIKATPVAAWRANGVSGPLWVNAVKLQNELDHAVVTDPRDLRGEWRAASFQHGRLGPAGDLTDTTTVYLVSSTRFEDALGAFEPLPRRTKGGPL